MIIYFRTYISLENSFSFVHNLQSENIILHITLFVSSRYCRWVRSAKTFAFLLVLFQYPNLSSWPYFGCNRGKYCIKQPSLQKVFSLRSSAFAQISGRGKYDLIDYPFISDCMSPCTSYYSVWGHCISCFSNVVSIYVLIFSTDSN